MPIVMPEMSAAPGGASSDIYLHVQTKRAGKIKGESTIAGHLDDIIVNTWQWGLAASSAIGSNQATGRRSYTALTVQKSIDQSTTGLMSALATNDLVKEARLTMRKAGGSQEDYFIITLKEARITGVSHTTAADGYTNETVSIMFTKVDVEYRPQKTSGARGGSFTFNDELVESA
ncbi:Hcp family type VI secretion system effector [Aquabacterium sp.]|uniref:Hcp family type VI secretion system effector n=1 Tax=Aquabacterium sp. TaxID=1872578 RepID=UPI002C7B43F9|nr:type VI secretion system tube protein Hcp [Aquabacterium sp.]HSW08714.1 type VI secretion system tube protein Hcp [Aquabacterium sp.]